MYGRVCVCMCVSGLSMTTTVGLRSTLGNSVLVALIAAAAVILRRCRTAKLSSLSRARPTAVFCGARVFTLAGVFAFSNRHQCRGSTSSLLTALEPIHTWPSRTLQWWRGSPLGLVLLYSCFCDTGTDLARLYASRISYGMWTAGICCGLLYVGYMWLHRTLRGITIWVFYL